ncbi:hypothetical protein KP509_13G071500 [Ceratopteris richardii]|uniref:Uncharacterized protein n=1 Tax=Ceratopteris richardii TaxID=49495 RepID=A0A8T2TJS8_CERRI|nr:hypothetical protein KP509_13G071500 [Ceratopteris richardii]
MLLQRRMATAEEPLLLGDACHRRENEEAFVSAEVQHLHRSEEDNILPIPPHHRTFTALDIASIWWGIVTSISTFYVAGVLVEEGMSWWQGLLTIVVSNIFQAICTILMGHAGAKYGIPFPVQCRASLGIHGAHFATFLRGIVACGWFSIDTWIGGQALFVFINAICNNALSAYGTISWLSTTLPELVCFFLFWLLQLTSIWHGVHGIKSLEKYASPVLLLCCGALLIWAYVKAGGFGEMLSASSQFGRDGSKYGQFWIIWFSGLTANVGSFATVALNISDFTRYARSQTDQILGQMGLPVFVGFFSFIGLAVSSSTERIFGYVVSNPIELLAQVGGAFTTLISLFGVTLAILTTNVANIVAPANALINISPRYMTFRRGALLTAFVGFLIQPWRLYQTGEAFLNTWLLGYSFLLGPLTGIILVDYYILRHCNLDIPALYGSDKVRTYEYFRGYNLKAFAAFFIGAISNLPGFLYTVGALKQVPSFWLLLYKVSWFSSFLLSGLSFFLLSVAPSIIECAQVDQVNETNRNI